PDRHVIWVASRSVRHLPTGMSVPNPVAIGVVEVVPVAMVKRPVAVGADVAAVVRLAIKGRQGLVRLRQVAKHRLAPLHIGLAVLTRHRVDAQGKERVAFGTLQVPAPVDLHCGEKPRGRKADATPQAAKAILLGYLLKQGARAWATLAPP